VHTILGLHNWIGCRCGWVHTVQIQVVALIDVCVHAALYATRSNRSDTSIADSLYCLGPAIDLPPHSIIRTLEFYLLFFMCFVTMGAALALLDNFPQLISSVAPTSVMEHSAPVDTGAASTDATTSADMQAPDIILQRLAAMGAAVWGVSQTAQDLLLWQGRGNVEGGDSCGGGRSDGGMLVHLGQTLLVVFSVCNTLGRIVAGFVPEQALHKHVRLYA
jgi:hypothetical protein